MFYSPDSGLQPETTEKKLDKGGRELAKVIFPESVRTLLIRSLAHINPEDGLRVRLCLDHPLSDLPWEYIVMPEVTGYKSPGDFLSLNARISLIREPPMPGHMNQAPRKKQRLLFFGSRNCSSDGKDLWETDRERDQLFSALEPAGALLEMKSILSDESDCETALLTSKSPVDIFHYSGHTDEEGGEGYLLASDVRFANSDKGRLYSHKLASLLSRLGTSLAVFSACNSGRRTFVEPLLQSGIPVVIGAQGLVFVDVAIAFSRKLYSALAIGLSLDEAVTWARLHLLEPGVLSESLKWQWGTFMVYMQTPESVLFPKPRQAGIDERQKAMRIERRQTIINIGKLVYQDIDQKIDNMTGGTVIASSIGRIGEP
jgi:hypothetical protein